MIVRRVEYIRYCDVDGCVHESEAQDWVTREQAEIAAARDGWFRLPHKRWMCPDCKAKAEKSQTAAASTKECEEKIRQTIVERWATLSEPPAHPAAPAREGVSDD